MRILSVVWVLAAAAAGAQAPALDGGSEAAAPQPVALEPAEAAPSLEALDAGASTEELAAIEKALAADAAPAPAAPAVPRFSALQSFNPDLAFIADVAAAVFSTDHPLQDGAHDPTKTGFNLQSLELAVGAAVDPYFRFDGNLVFGLSGVELEEAYATTLALPHRLQARAGQFLTRFGRLNNTHPHAWQFTDQPFAYSRVFGGDANRGLGAELSWLAPLPWYVELLGSATDAAGEGTARSFYGADDLGVHGPLDLQLTFAAKQFFPLSEAWSLSWGLSGAVGPNSSAPGNKTQVYGTDVYLKWRPLSGEGFNQVMVQLEVLHRRRALLDDTLYDTSGYAYLVWRFEKRWSVAGRYEYGSGPGGCACSVAEDPLDPQWVSDRHRVSANLTFRPTEFSRLRLQSSVDVPTWQAQPNIAAFLAFEVAVGAHGAHPF